jgi:predicted DNA-binding protein
MKDDKVTTIRMSKEVRNLLETEAEQRGVKLGWLIREILSSYLNGQFRPVRLPTIESKKVTK